MTMRAPGGSTGGGAAPLAAWGFPNLTAVAGVWSNAYLWGNPNFTEWPRMPAAGRLVGFVLGLGGGTPAAGASLEAKVLKRVAGGSWLDFSPTLTVAIGETYQQAWYAADYRYNATDQLRVDWRTNVGWSALTADLTAIPWVVMP